MAKQSDDARALRDKAWDLVAQTCLYLDQEDYEKYLALMEEDCTYTISWYSPELLKDVVLLHHTRPSLATLVENIKNHIVLPGKLFRLAYLYTLQDKEGAYAATSYVTVTHTDEYGASRLFCVARYLDRMVPRNGGMRLGARHVRMETRDIGPGCHFPI